MLWGSPHAMCLCSCRTNNSCAVRLPRLGNPRNFHRIEMTFQEV